MFYVVVHHRFGKSYLVIGSEVSMLGCKYVATKFNTVNEAFDGACYLQTCPQSYGHEYSVIDDNENVQDVPY